MEHAKGKPRVRPESVRTSEAGGARRGKRSHPFAHARRYPQTASWGHSAAHRDDEGRWTELLRSSGFKANSCLFPRKDGHPHLGPAARWVRRVRVFPGRFARLCCVRCVPRRFLGPLACALRAAGATGPGGLAEAAACGPRGWLCFPPSQGKVCRAAAPCTAVVGAWLLSSRLPLDCEGNALSPPRALTPGRTVTRKRGRHPSQGSETSPEIPGRLPRPPPAHACVLARRLAGGCRCPARPVRGGGGEPGGGTRSVCHLASESSRS